MNNVSMFAAGWCGNAALYSLVTGSMVGVVIFLGLMGLNLWITRA